METEFTSEYRTLPFEQELMDAVNQWESAECADCRAHFTNQGEAFEHGRIPGHSLMHLYSAKAVN